MGFCEWTEDDWSTLIYTIKRGNCILMLGPNFVVEEYNSEIRSSTEVLAYEVAQAEQVKKEVEEWKIDPYNLAQVTQCYDIKDMRYDLEDKVHQFYCKRDSLSVDFHNSIASLPFSFIITATPDKTFYNALKRWKKEPVVEIYNYNGNNKDTVVMGTIEKPLLYYLFGNIDELDSLILTENDILDFIFSIATKNPKLPNNIISTLRDSRQTMLFLGFSFRNWYLRVLLHVLHIRKKKGRSFALDEISIQGIDDFQSVIFFYKESDYRINICNMELGSFVKELGKRFPAGPSVKTQGPSVETRDLTGAPTVFLCHASENKAFADKLYNELEAAGIKPWLDKKDIHVGNSFDSLIKKTIEEVDYFVVLQSKDMVNKIEGYAHKEILLALERQKEFRADLVFIIPAFIDDCQLMDSLKDRHTIDLSNRENINILIKDIKRDFEKRRKK